jgi:hypothetical protein
VGDASRKNQLEFHLHQKEETPFRLELGWGWKVGLATTGLMAMGVLLAVGRVGERLAARWAGVRLAAGRVGERLAVGRADVRLAARWAGVRLATGRASVWLAVACS